MRPAATILLFLFLISRFLLSIGSTKNHKQYHHRNSHREHHLRVEFGTDEKREKQSNIWALLVAGSNGWANYRHQADICHAQHILASHGISPDHIITMMADDIAHNHLNPYPGKIYNRPDGPNLYENIVKDYTGEDVTPENFLHILQGHDWAVRGVGSGKVIDSGPNDHIFVFFADHGATNIICFPDDVLHNTDLIKVLNRMHARKRYKQLVFYLEACESGSMFRKLLRDDIDVYAISAANYHESSWGCYCKNDMHLPCMGDLFSVNWMEDSDTENLLTETLYEQYMIVKDETNKSHVRHFGNLSIGRESVANFQGYFSPRNRPFNNRKDSGVIIDKSPWPAHDIPLLTLTERHATAVSESEKLRLSKKIHRLHQNRIYLEKKMAKLVNSLLTVGMERRSVWRHSARQLNEFDCHKAVTKAFNRICFPFNRNPYALKYVYVLANLCEKVIDPKRIIRKMQNVCISIHLPFGGVQ